MVVLNYIDDSGYIDESLRKEILSPLMNKWLPPRGTSPSDAEVVFSVAYRCFKMLLDAFEKEEKIRMGLFPGHPRNGVKESSKGKDKDKKDMKIPVEENRIEPVISLDPGKADTCMQPTTSMDLDHFAKPLYTRRQVQTDEATKSTIQSNGNKDKDVEDNEWTMVEHGGDEEIREHDWLITEEDLDEKNKPRKLYALSAFRGLVSD